MEVWRIEHKCEHPHGPVSVHRDSCRNAYRPSYGAILSPPQSDELLRKHFIIKGPGIEIGYRREFIFGTTAKQFNRWWTEGPEPLRDNWYACLYETEDEFTFVGTHQVMFDSYHAVEVYRTVIDFPGGML